MKASYARKEVFSFPRPDVRVLVSFLLPEGVSPPKCYEIRKKPFPGEAGGTSEERTEGKQKFRSIRGERERIALDGGLGQFSVFTLVEAYAEYQGEGEKRRFRIKSWWVRTAPSEVVKGVSEDVIRDLSERALRVHRFGNVFDNRETWSFSFSDMLPVGAKEDFLFRVRFLDSVKEVTAADGAKVAQKKENRPILTLPPRDNTPEKGALALALEKARAPK